mmetsp:Transcript_737/g.1747  ORF Transcript_737/g.1747 Transcript_737/m.1747 type:complete len:404 (+) Transcript_737:287-1498(+)
MSVFRDCSCDCTTPEVDWFEPSDNKRKAERGQKAGLDSKRQDCSTTVHSTVMLDRNNLEPAKELLNAVMRNPQLVHDPDLRFIKNFLAHFGCSQFPSENFGKTRSGDHSRSGGTSGEGQATNGSEDVSSTHRYPGEPECEEDDYLEERIDEKLIAPETVAPPPLGRDPAIEPSAPEMERAAEQKLLGTRAVEEGDMERAIEHFTLALQLLPSALLYARRAEALLREKRPTAALQDCNEALKLNSDSAKALKTRGGVYRALGEWEKACRDLSQGLSIDFDEESSKLHQECLGFYESVQAKKRARERREQIRLEEEMRQRGGPPSPSGQMRAFMEDPQMVAALKNPKVVKAMHEVMANPSASAKYMVDPDVAPVMMKLVARSTPGGQQGAESEVANTADSGPMSL